MTNQKEYFNLPTDITFLNGAYMSPQLKSVSNIGHNMVDLKENPFNVTHQHFFEARTTLRKSFARLIEAQDYHNVAIIPSVSYGLANVAHNCRLEKGDEIVLIHQQFPSNVYAWTSIAKQVGAKIVTVQSPKAVRGRGKLWNESLLNAISSKTKVVAIPQIHWADGTKFNLKAIRQRTHEVGAKLIIDGTQSVGAYSFSVKEIDVDAIICGGYKWLLGPYGLGMAYYADSLCDGHPIEQNWMNRLGSEDFTKLVNYQEEYQPKAGRYSVGESSNFILTPMLTEAINQLIRWQPKEIQKYCEEIVKGPIDLLRAKGFFVEDDTYRASHLFGVYVPEEKPLNSLKEKLDKERIFVSYRGDAIRISPNVYNTQEDLEKLADLL